jgi:hypothetical protein
VAIPYPPPPHPPPSSDCSLSNCHFSVSTVEGFYCKRPNQCLASLTPHPLTARRVCTPPPLEPGENTLARGRGGWGSKTPDTALYSIYVSTLWYILSLFRFADILFSFLTYLFYTEMKSFIFRILGFGALARSFYFCFDSHPDLPKIFLSICLYTFS